MANHLIHFWRQIQCVPLATEPSISLIILPLTRILQPNLKRTTDTFLFISHTTNVPLFKFRCNIFIGVRIIKEMPGSLASGTLCIIVTLWGLFCFVRCIASFLEHDLSWPSNISERCKYLFHFCISTSQIFWIIVITFASRFYSFFLLPSIILVIFG